MSETRRKLDPEFLKGLPGIIDAFSRQIVGWRVAAHMHTSMVLDGLEMARWSRRARLEDPIMHSDAGIQGGFNWLSQHLEMVRVRDGAQVRACRGGFVRCEASPGRQAGLRLRGGRIGFGSGMRLLPDSRVRTPPVKLASRWRLDHPGSAKLAGCYHLIWPQSRAAICHLPNVTRSRPCTPNTLKCARSPADWDVHPRR